MAGRGPAPKEPSKRTRRNKVAETPIAKAAKAKKPPLLPGSRRFSPATRRWYQVWATSLQASQFFETDWLRLHMTAKLVDLFYRADEAALAKQLMSEIRLNEAKLGGTPEDRLRLRWRLSDAERAEEQPAARKPGSSARPRRRGDPRLKLVQGGGA